MISVVIPAHNAARTIGDCVQAICRQTLGSDQYEIIVVDDGSSDETARLAAAAGATVIRQARSRPAAARNTGIQAARGEIVCFTDADCFPRPDWLVEIATPFANPDIVGGKGTYATHQPELVARFVQIEYEDKYDRLRKQRRIDFIDTYSAAYRRSVLLANDGFDENFPYLEDQELSFRLAARGYEMVFQPSAVVYHLHSQTIPGYFRKKFTIGYWKAQVVRRFPGRGVQDSHTPQVMKVQMGLMALIYFLALATLLSLWAALPLVALALLFVVVAVFLLSAAPFVGKAWAKDRTVALAAPLLLAVRATALGLGYTWGLVRPRPGISGEESTIGGLNYLGKRGMDLAASLAGLSFAGLVGPFIALAIKLNSPGPVFFHQQRIGQGGRPFTIYKFRSMYANAETELDKLIDLDSLNEPVFKLKGDPRITAVGRFLRRWSLDELPQFWNVLKGDMSLIGPRPEEARIAARYNDWHRRRLAIKPGMTGPMQVNGRGDLPLDARVRLELDYIENYSLWRDVVIAAKTVPAILKGNGAR
ncbi:MAG: sugar transferase [Chloroflexi bacterium]|nr:sugar transferase [Chloroflexota bacterium]MCI0580025.1 sugar transferase [Chloroflexota bacterium]MCI0646780.1 sugar transferase [Chloroflexota bacterium]MCI0730192.1 sugar transferase [Chloroflexota bacterium]